MADCEHKEQVAEVDVVHLEDSGRWQADVRIQCASCRTPFRFVGEELGVGASAFRPMRSYDRTELRVPIAPEGGPAPRGPGFDVGMVVR